MINNRLMAYGILKRGYELDLTQAAFGGKFLGEAQINGANLYRIGSGVGLRLVDDPNKVAHGELFEIPDKLWRWLDMIEQNPYVYKRQIVEVSVLDSLERVSAWVYVHNFPNMKYENLIENGRF